MGLFSGSKKIYVSSVVYNMAGDIAERPVFLKSLVMGSIIGESKFSIGDVLQQGYASGPGSRLKAFYRWAVNNYQLIGIPGGSIFTRSTVNYTIILNELGNYGITDAAINWVETAVADITYWGMQYLAIYAPELTAQSWKIDYDEGSNTAIITFDSGTFNPIIFTPVGFDARKGYVYVSYSRANTNGTYREPEMFIYQVGSGNTNLDGQYLIQSLGGAYMPFIPVRADNKFLSKSFRPNEYALAKKAYKKAIDGELDELIGEISKNDSLSEIDYATVFFGVPLNTQSNIGKEYIYRYMRRLIQYQTVNEANYENWRNNYDGGGSSGGGGTGGYVGGKGQFEQWQDQQEQQVQARSLSASATTTSSSSPPPRPVLPYIPRNSIYINVPFSSASYYEVKMQIDWQSTLEEAFTGVGKDGAKPGDLWWSIDGVEPVDLVGYGANYYDSRNFDKISLYWQTETNKFTRLNFRGLKHTNWVYQGKSVELDAKDALTDTDESGFLFPIHYGTFQELSMVKQTQLAMESSYLMFNCYQIVKKKWYQTGFFKVVLAIIIVVITFYTGGFGAGTAGLLGTNATVGAAIGFSGLAAVIAGAVANMVAAIIVTKLITVASVAILGEKVGMIVAAIASFVALNVGSTLSTGGSLSSSFSNMMSASNLINFTNSVGNAYSSILGSNAQGWMQKTEDVMKDYRQQSLDIQKQYREVLGYGSLVYDPMTLTNSGQQFFTESIDSFLGRTLMTGMDVAEISHEVLSDFATLTLQPSLPN